MKTIFLLLAMVLIFPFKAFQQEKPEAKIPARNKLIVTDENEAKYYTFNPKRNELLLFNLDNSLWKTLPIPLEKYEFFEELLLLSRKTIQPDENFELLYATSKYDYSISEENLELSGAGIHYFLNAMDESGIRLLRVSESNHFRIVQDNGSPKLLVYKSAGKSFSLENEILVYALPLK